MAPLSTLQVPPHKRKFWAEFFALYEHLPVLWDARNEFYKYRNCKLEAYDKLVEKLRQVEPQADRQDVLRKINIFRTNYRRERARVLSSDTQGKDYKSTLWYYDMLSFLQTQEEHKRGKQRGSSATAIDYTLQHHEVTNSWTTQLDYNNSTNSTSSSAYECKRPDFSYITEDSSTIWQRSDSGADITAPTVQMPVLAVAKPELQLQSTPPTTMLSPKMEVADEVDFGIQYSPPVLRVRNVEAPLDNSTGNTESNERNDKPKLIIRNLTPELDDRPRLRTAGDGNGLSTPAEILARSWAIQYDEMAAEQKIYARKAISEILFKGCMGRLGANRRSEEF